ncbi:hypothetical protein C8Q79DRAFT_1013358 [Trametes meyenii]|nr:hypothetical protein C8Q79DRAFT_1013358 [Trametes meyenii]
MSSTDTMNLFDFSAFEDVASWFISGYAASTSDSDDTAPNHEREQDQPFAPSYAPSPALFFPDSVNGGQAFLPNVDESVSYTPGSCYSESSSPIPPPSPLSVTSEDTLVDPLADPLYNAVLNPIDIEKWQFEASFSDFSFRPDSTVPVMYSGPTFPTVEDPPAYSSPFEIPSCGQPQQQHLLGAVDASASWDMMSTPAAVAPLIPQATVPLPEKAGGECEADSEDSDVKKPAKRRKQSTEKTLICPHCGSGWARRNNLNTHIKAVHKGVRAHTCSAPGCARAFSRKHDLQRHFQSEHTDKGSPRRKAPKA